MAHSADGIEAVEGLGTFGGEVGGVGAGGYPVVGLIVGKVLNVGYFGHELFSVAVAKNGCEEGYGFLVVVAVDLMHEP